MTKSKKKAEPAQEEPVLAPKVEQTNDSTNSPETTSEETDVEETPEEENESSVILPEPDTAEEDEAKKFADETLAKARALRKRN